MPGFMNPESNGFAPGGLETSVGFCALSGSVVTEWSVSALLTHSTVCPTLIATFIGVYIGGLSVILTTTSGAASAVAGATSAVAPLKARSPHKIAAKLRPRRIRLRVIVFLIE